MKTTSRLSAALLLACSISACQEPASPPPATTVTPPPADTTAAEATGPLRRLSLDEVAAPSQPSTLCNIEYLGQQLFGTADVEVAPDGNARLSGWIGDETVRGPAQDASLRLESTADRSQVWDTPLTLGTKREDVVASFREQKLELAGFSQDIPLGQLPAGRYHLYVTYPSQGKRFLCDNGRYFAKGN